MAGRAAVAARPARGPALRRGRGAAAPPAPDRPHRQPGPGARPGHRTGRGRLRARRRGRRPRGRRCTEWLLAVAARDRPGGVGVPAATTARGDGRRPARVRRGGRPVRGARRLQPPPRRQPRPVGPAAGRGRGGRAAPSARAGSSSCSTSSPGRIRSSSCSPSADSTTSGVELSVVDRGERLGSITVEMPAGHPLRRWQHRLLADLADQAGMAFRNARLTAELSGQVARLDRRTRELADSRRRLISAADAERSRVERAIAQQVVVHLAPLPGRLRRLTDTTQITPLAESLTSAIEALREITRGVFPAQLVRSGLPMALVSLLARTGSAERLVIHDSVADGVSTLSSRPRPTSAWPRSWIPSACTSRFGTTSSG